jgi:hypothetical protein
MEPAGRLFAKLDIAQDQEMAEARACAAWKRAAGKKIADRSRAVALVRGKLVVEVEDIVWQKQLAVLSKFLIANLARELGDGIVSGLDFRPMPPRRGPQRAETARPVAAPADEAARIKDPVLRSLYRESRKRESA